MGVELNKESLKIWQEENLEHLRYEYPLRANDYCIDIGSYRQEWANEIKSRYGCMVECFDALDNRAASDMDGYITLGGQYYYSSIFDKETEQRTFKCYDIAPYLQRECALCKINIEGYEYALLTYIMAKGLHKNIKNIQVQFHETDDSFPYENAYLRIAKELSKTHELQWRYPFVWESWRRKDL